MKNRNLALLLSGQLVSQTGDKLYMLALAFMVLNTTGSASKMGLVFCAGILPLVTVGLFSGVAVDRFDRKKIIVFTDTLRGVIVSAVSLLYCQGRLTFGMILLSQILLGINAAFFNPTIPSVIPTIVKENELSRANAKTQFVSGFSNIAGPALGGVLVSLYGYLFVFVLNAVSYLMSALFESFLNIPSAKRAPHAGVRHAVNEGYRHIVSDRKLLIILLMVFIIHFFVGSIEVCIPFIANLLPGNGPLNLGYIQTTFGAGAVAMALLLSCRSIDGKESSTLFAAVASIGLLLGLIGLCGFAGADIAAMLALFFLFNASIILAGTSFQSLIQKHSDPSMTGRVFGVVSSVGNFSIPLAMLLYGVMLEHVSTYPLLCFSGLTAILVSGLFFLAYSKAEHRKALIRKANV